MKYVKKLVYDRKNNAVYINDKYEIDTKDGAIYYSWDYDGNRDKDFPQWLFELRCDLRDGLKCMV